MEALIIGCGFAGTTVARKFAEQNIKVRMIERRNHIGGNCYDCNDEHRQCNGCFQDIGAFLIKLTLSDYCHL